MERSFPILYCGDVMFETIYDGITYGIKIHKAVSDSLGISQFTIARRLPIYSEFGKYVWVVETNPPTYLDDWEIEKVM